MWRQLRFRLFWTGDAISAVSTVALPLLAINTLDVLRRLVDRPDRPPHANRAVEPAHAGAALVGPGVGGALVGALTAAGVVLLDALSFLAGALLNVVDR